MNLIKRYEESGRHALEVHLAACIMFEETKWRRTKDTRPRNQVVEDAVREGCNALIRLCQERRFKPAQHDYEPE
ncbi:MAG: hypothetical protein RIR41_1325 [Pseudomonadota bacterium]|jgi:hypothetical protein